MAAKLEGQARADAAARLGLFCERDAEATADLAGILNTLASLESELATAQVLQAQAEARVQGLVTAADQAQARVDALEAAMGAAVTGRAEAEERTRAQDKRAIAAELELVNLRAGGQR